MIDVQKSCDLTNATDLLSITLYEALGIQKREVERGLPEMEKNLLPRLGWTKKPLPRDITII